MNTYLQENKNGSVRTASRILAIGLLGLYAMPGITQEAGGPGSLQDYAGLWVETNPQSGPPVRMRITPRDNVLAVWTSYTDIFSDQVDGLATVGPRGARWTIPQGCAPRFQTPGYNYDNPGMNYFSIAVTQSNDGGQPGRTLIYTQDVRWNAPCGGHPIGTERIQKRLSEVNHIKRRNPALPMLPNQPSQLNQPSPANAPITPHMPALPIKPHAPAPPTGSTGQSSPPFYRWVPANNGSVPQGAVVGGSEGGHPLYVCRAGYNGSTFPGKVVGRTCNFSAANGKENLASSYEVLTAQSGAYSLDWQRSGNRPPANALVGGRWGEDLYLCQLPYSGGLHPGWANTQQNGQYVCSIGFGGREADLPGFSYLVPIRGQRID